MNLNRKWLGATVATLIVLVAFSAVRGPVLASGTTAHIYLRLDPAIKGESLHPRHRDEIEVESFSFGVKNAGPTGPTGGGGAGRTTAGDLSITKDLDSSSPKLFDACCRGDRIRQAVLTCTRGGTDDLDYYKITFDNVIITSLSQTGAEVEAAEGSPGHRIIEELTLSYERIRLEYYQQDATGKPKGTVTGGWNFTTGTKQ